MINFPISKDKCIFMQLTDSTTRNHMSTHTLKNFIYYYKLYGLV